MYFWTKKILFSHHRLRSLLFVWQRRMSDTKVKWRFKEWRSEYICTRMYFYAVTYKYTFFTRWFFFLSYEFTRPFKELFEDRPQHFKHFVHEGAEFKMWTINLARACRLRDAIRLSWVLVGEGLFFLFVCGLFLFMRVDLVLFSC